MGCLSTAETTKDLYIAFTQRLRDQVGAKFQTVVHGKKGVDYEGVVNVLNDVTDDDNEVVFQPTTDYDAYLATLVVKCTIFPNLHDKDLQDSYGVMGAEALLKKILLPGEYADYLKVVQTVNGFDVGMEEAVEEAKNL